MDDDTYALARRNIETVIGCLEYTIDKDSKALAEAKARLAALEKQYENEVLDRERGILSVLSLGSCLDSVNSIY